MSAATAGVPGPVLVFGLGYLGRRLGLRLGAAGIDCAGTTRGDPADAVPDGIARLRFPAPDPGPLQARIAAAGAVLASIPPDAAGDPAIRAFADALASAPALRWIGVLSSTGVYAGRDGGVVDAGTPADGDDPAARQRLLAEAQWTEAGRRRGVPVHVFRLAGLYGPGRNALVQLADGRARWLDRPGVLFNRIHVDDACDAVLAALRAAFPPGRHTWLLADGAPAAPRDVLAHAAALSGRLLPPPLAADDPRVTPALLRFHAGSKRIDNRATREGLGWTPRHPDWRAGLDALWAEGEGRPAGDAVG